MSTRGSRRRPILSAPPDVTLVPSTAEALPDAPAESGSASGLAHPAIHARAVQGGAWKILATWARAS